MQIFVLGMHRSGTSVVTRLLNLMGAYFGPDDVATGANEENPKGFWERIDVRTVCDRLLHGAGADWWKISNFSVDAIPDDVRDRQRAAFTDVLADLDQHRPWVVKEPRLCLLLPVIRQLLEAPVAIITHRDPFEIAQSLQRRNGFPLTFGVALWEAYMRNALAASADMPRIVVGYSDVLADPMAASRRIREELSAHGVEGLTDPPDEEVKSFVDRALYRNRSDGAGKLQFLTQPQQRLAAALDDGSAVDAELGAVSHAAQDILAMFELAQAADGDIPTLRALEKRNVELDRELAQERATADLLRQRRDELTLELAAVREELDKRPPPTMSQGQVERKIERLERQRDKAQKRYRDLRSRRAVRAALRLSAVASKITPARRRG